jgi:hypothetical protein
MVYNIKLIDFSELYTTTIQKTLLDSLHHNCCLMDNQILLRRQDVKNLITIIVNQIVSDLLKSVQNDKTVLVVQPVIIPRTEIHEYCDFEKFQTLLHKILKNLRKEFPKNIFIFKKMVNLSSADTHALIYHKANIF